MSNGESVAGINVRKLADENQWLKTRCAQLQEEARQQEEFYGNRIGILESRNLQLEREVEWLHQAEAHIQQLEEALRFCRQLFQDIVDECGVEGSLEEVEAIKKADAALSGEAPEKEE